MTEGEQLVAVEDEAVERTPEEIERSLRQVILSMLAALLAMLDINYGIHAIVFSYLLSEVEYGLTVMAFGIAVLLQGIILAAMRVMGKRINLKWYIVSQMILTGGTIVTLQAYIHQEGLLTVTTIDDSTVSVRTTVVNNETISTVYIGNSTLADAWYENADELRHEAIEEMSEEISFYILLRIRDVAVLLYTPFAMVGSDLRDQIGTWILCFIYLTYPIVLKFSIPSDVTYEWWLFSIRMVFFGVLSVFVLRVNFFLKESWLSILRHEQGLRDELKKHEKDIQKSHARARAMIQHGIKNICASMSASCEVALEDPDATIEDLRRELKRVQGLASMGVVLCNKRAKMAMVESDRFQPLCLPVDCCALLNSVATISPRIQISSSCNDLVALGDEDVIYFVLENALTNAVRHGLSGTPIYLSVVGDVSTKSVTFAVANHVDRGFRFRHGMHITKEGEILPIASVCDDQKPLEDDVVRSCNQSLGKKNCGLVKKGSPENKELKTRRLRKTELLSEGLGMRIIKSCVRKGRYELKFYQSGERVILEFKLPMTSKKTHRRNRTGDTSHSSLKQSSSFHFDLVENQEVKNSNPMIALKTSPVVGTPQQANTPNQITPSSSVQKKKDIETISEEPESKKDKLSICCVEDEKLIRKMYERVLIRKYFSDKSVVLGESAQEVESVIGVVMEKKIDAVLLDQNLEYDGKCIKGTDIARRLRAIGFDGVIIMRSANTEEHDQQLYSAAGADGMSSKSQTSKQIADVVHEKVALNEKLRKRRSWRAPQNIHPRPNGETT